MQNARFGFGGVLNDGVRPGDAIRRHLLHDLPLGFRRPAPQRPRWADMNVDDDSDMTLLWTSGDTATATSDEDMPAARRRRLTDSEFASTIAGFQVFVKTLAGLSLTMWVVNDNSTDRIREIMSMMTGVSANCFDVSYNGRVLRDGTATVASLRITRDDQLWMLVSPLSGGTLPNHIEDLDMGNMSVENRALMKLGRPHSQTSTGSSCSSLDDDIVAALRDVLISTSGDAAGSTASSSGAAPLAVRSAKRIYTEISPHGIREPNLTPIGQL
jgi:hypothetical protein